jgi:hypothetical protein
VKVAAVWGFPRDVAPDPAIDRRHAGESTEQKACRRIPGPKRGVPITIIERDGVCSISTGKITGTDGAGWWITAAMASPVTRLFGLPF